MNFFTRSESCRFSILRGLAAAAFGLAMLHPGAARAQNDFGTNNRYCNRSAISQVLSPTTGNVLGSAAGAAIGGLIGSKIGKSSGNTAATIIGALGGALGGGYIGRSMDPADQGCVTESLDHAPVNQPVAWQNPNTGSSYWITPTRNLRGPNGEPCREYVTDALVDGRREQSTHTACRQPNGSWMPMAANEVHAAPAYRAAPAPAPAPSALSRSMVFKVQQRLHDLGFYVRDNIDGQWGPHTVAALRNFQMAQGLRPTGQLDPRTLAALHIR